MWWRALAREDRTRRSASGPPRGVRTGGVLDTGLVPATVTELRDSRELLLKLVRRDLSGRYRRSILGWAWTLVTPLATIAIFSLVFGVFLKIDVPAGNPSGLSAFALFLVSGLVSWNFFSNTLNGAMSALIGNATLVTRVYFPREVLVAAAIGSALVTFAVELAVLLSILLVLGVDALVVLPALLALVITQSVFVLGIALLAAPLNVYFRDLQYGVGIVLQLLFYATPVIYPIETVPRDVDVFGWTVPLRDIYAANPIAQFVKAFRITLYDGRMPSIATFSFLVAVSVITLLVGIMVFRRLEPRLAEEL